MMWLTKTKPNKIQSQTDMKKCCHLVDIRFSDLDRMSWNQSRSFYSRYIKYHKAMLPIDTHGVSRSIPLAYKAKY